MTGFTQHTPDAVRGFLTSRALGFDEGWTLNQVAEESNRRHLARRWKNHAEGMAAVCHWALWKLATRREFSADSWDLIASVDRYGHTGGHSRIAAILSPAFGLTSYWRKSPSEREEALDEIKGAAKLLLRALHSDSRLAIGFADAVGVTPGARPLADSAADLSAQHLAEIRKEVAACKEAGKPIEFGPSYLRGFRAPDLHDYLVAFLDKIEGALKPYYGTPSHLREFYAAEAEAEESEEGGEDGDELDLEEWDPESIADLDERFGMNLNPRPVALSPGGEFGAYPKRKDALERAVILAFPEPLLEREAPMPDVTLAATIEEACMAWFGESRTQKEINALIKDRRAEIEARLVAERESLERAQKAEAKLIQKLGPAKDMSEQLRRFLDLE